MNVVFVVEKQGVKWRWFYSLYCSLWSSGFYRSIVKVFCCCFLHLHSCVNC